MATIVTRSGKGSPLTHAEVDSNFTNLNTDKLELSGGTMTGNLSFGDNDKAIFGAGSDLQIYHDGSNSYIQDAGTGNLLIKSDGSGTYVRNASDQNIISAQGDEARMHYAGPVKLKTTSTGISVTGNATFADNGKAIFGAGSDLQIYHDAANSFIEESGTGNLIVAGSTEVKIRNTTGGANLAVFKSGAVDLYASGTKRLATTSTGVDITGTLTSDGLTVDGVISAASVSDTASDYSLLLDATAVAANYGHNIGFDTAGGVASAIITRDEGSTNKTGLAFATGDASGISERLRVSYNGDISFYEDTGTTAKFFWDASVEGLGIGDTSFTNKLNVTGSMGSAGTPLVQLYENSGSARDGLYLDYTGTTNSAVYSLKIADASKTHLAVRGDGNVGIGTSSPSALLHASSSAGSTAIVEAGSGYNSRIRILSDTGSYLEFGDPDDSDVGEIVYDHSSNYMRFNTNASERMRIDSSGNVGIGTSSPSSPITVSRSVYGGYDAILLENTNANAGVINSTAIKLNAGSGGTAKIVMQNASASNQDSSELSFFTGDGGTSSEAMRIDSSGNVGIGTSSPLYTFHTQMPSDGSTGAAFRYLGGTNNPGLFLSVNESTTDVVLNASGSTSANLVFSTTTERMRIDSSGNLLVGTTDTSVWNNNAGSNADFGFTVIDNGYVAATSYNQEVMYLNRTGTDGSILQFRKDGSTVASIGVNAGDLTIYSTTASHAGLKFGNTVILPTNNAGVNADNAMSLGVASTRFKDLYLSGGVYLGGTGSANKLDDYEEGTWTVDLKEGANSLTLGNNVGVYTKVGDVVTVWATANNITKSGTGALRMYGLPFASKSDSGLALYVSGSVRLTRFTSAYTGVPICRSDDGTSYLRFTWLYNGNGNDQEMTASDIADATNADINICLTYKTA